jgi:hypothetical protein
VDFSSFKKIEGAPDLARSADAKTGSLAVIVKLREGAEQPAYLQARATFGPRMFTTEIRLEQLEQLENDPAVESVSQQKPLNRIE